MSRLRKEGRFTEFTLFVESCILRRLIDQKQGIARAEDNCASMIAPHQKGCGFSAPDDLQSARSPRPHRRSRGRSNSHPSPHPQERPGDCSRSAYPHRTGSRLSRSGEPTARRPRDAALLARPGSQQAPVGRHDPRRIRTSGSPELTPLWARRYEPRGRRGCICLTAHIRLPRSR